MATAFKELLSQGLVTARDITLLNDGEIAEATDCIYRPNDPAVWKAPGRTAYGTVHADSIASVTTSGAVITKTNAFGTGITVGITSGSTTMTSAAAFTSGMVGFRVYGTGIASSTYIASFTSTSSVELTIPATATNATASITVSTYEPGMFVLGARTAANSTILTVDSASQITLDTACLSNGSDTIVISSPIKAVLFLSFANEGQPDELLAYANSRFYTSAYSGDTGTFASFLTGLSNVGTEYAESIKDGKNQIILSGGNAPRRVYFKNISGTDTLTQAVLGMQPVTNFFVERVAGSWSSVLGTGVYYFMVTEVFNAGDEDEQEGTFNGTPQYVDITNVTAQGIRVHRNSTDTTAKVNDGTHGTNAATHWRVYMAPKLASGITTPIPALHLFTRVATVDISLPYTDLLDANPSTFYCSPFVFDATGYSFAWQNNGGFIAPTGPTTVSAVSGVTGTYTLTTASSVANVKVGMPVYMDNVAAGATVVSVVTGSPNTITLSRPHSGTVGSGTCSFGAPPATDGNYVSFPMWVAATDLVGARLSNFGFVNSTTYAGKTVIGVEVRILGKYTSTLPPVFRVKMTTTSGAVTLTKTASPASSGMLTSGLTAAVPAGTWGYTVFGGPTDTWGRTWNTGLTDFLNGIPFYLHVEGYKPQNLVYNSGAQSLINSVEIRIFFSGTDVNLDGEPFRSVIVQDQIGETVTFGADAPPPSCDTGDVIEGQLIVNDLSNPSVVRGSVPGEFASFPGIYEMNITSRGKEILRVIRRVGSIGVFFCQDTIKRLNYFPTEVDSDGTHGRAWEDISIDHGCVSKRGVALFDMPSRGLLAAFISHNGLWVTDGITCWPANEDLDWPNTVSRTNLANAQLVSYPELYSLVMYYTPTGGAYNTKSLWYSYHPSHLKDGMKLAAMGPVQCRAKSAVRTNLNGVSKLLTGNLGDGKVYLEDSGTTSADTLCTITPSIKTRLIYPNDVGGQARIERVWLRMGAHGNATTGVITAALTRQNIGENLTTIDPITATTDATALTDDKLIVVHLDDLVESIQVKVSKADLAAAMRLHYITLLGEGYGLEKNRV